MQCFCPAGVFGRNCERTSSIKDGRANFDPKRYELVSSRGVDFYWRMIEESDEVEGVIVGKNTNSYVAVGKRITYLTSFDLYSHEENEGGISWRTYYSSPTLFLFSI